MCPSLSFSLSTPSASPSPSPKVPSTSSLHPVLPPPPGLWPRCCAAPCATEPAVCVVCVGGWVHVLCLGEVMAPPLSLRPPIPAPPETTSNSPGKSRPFSRWPRAPVRLHSLLLPPCQTLLQPRLLRHYLLIPPPIFRHYLLIPPPLFCPSAATSHRRSHCGSRKLKSPDDNPRPHPCLLPESVAGQFPLREVAAGKDFIQAHRVPPTIPEEDSATPSRT
ncbi:PREDICTED: uncharacterized protein LOC106726036 isoform X3 [Myotis brandtii]|uniref:uncharacterized protein LOC106726036 isoform X3 n=1 Tax=Myotis brandtii TaxID=109478 RepID=UPI000703F1CD|nr:PREDICTED: uncharacterized protein LOC106726036 isoform X3 [Myotis brandtii]